MDASIGDIEQVLVDDAFKKRNRKLVVDDCAAIKAKFVQSGRRIQEVALELPRVESALGERFSSGAEIVQGPSVDVIRGEGTGYGPLFLRPWLLDKSQALNSVECAMASRTANPDFAANVKVGRMRAEPSAPLAKQVAVFF
ncbi:hypothetical protein NM208_g349 [Fusarium decemcellulare]|uniref:Uncharacterized protein n=1 Tax=Fusarium decemcellulare TaxID=57161 RepID=A0ACC1SZQ7_9HYPO|nr:hypothetical protein NM208_g349 [Fusarium decemcellulare]